MLSVLTAISLIQQWQFECLNPNKIWLVQSLKKRPWGVHPSYPSPHENAHDWKNILFDQLQPINAIITNRLLCCIQLLWICTSELYIANWPSPFDPLPQSKISNTAKEWCLHVFSNVDGRLGYSRRWNKKVNEQEHWISQTWYN